MAEVAPGLIKVETTPTLEQVKARWGKRFDDLKDKSVPYKKASIYLDRWVQTNFKTEGGKVGGWKPLAAGGRYKKGKFDANAKILQDTARLKFSFIPWATKTNAGIGSDIPYSEPHEKGLNGLPMRRMLPRRREVIGDIREIFNQHIRDSFRGMMKQARGVAKGVPSV